MCHCSQFQTLVALFMNEWISKALESVCVYSCTEKGKVFHIVQSQLSSEMFLCSLFPNEHKNISGKQIMKEHLFHITSCSGMLCIFHFITLSYSCPFTNLLCICVLYVCVCIQASELRQLTRHGDGMGKGRAAAGQLALLLSPQREFQWSLCQCFPAGKWIPCCSALSGRQICVGLWWRRAPGLCLCAWRYPYACGLCIWLWEAGQMWMRRQMIWCGGSWMTLLLGEAWRWHL